MQIQVIVKAWSKKNCKKTVKIKFKYKLLNNSSKQKTFVATII